MERREIFKEKNRIKNIYFGLLCFKNTNNIKNYRATTNQYAHLIYKLIDIGHKILCLGRVNDGRKEHREKSRGEEIRDEGRNRNLKGDKRK